VGPITGLWIKEQTKLEILTVIESSRQQGVSAITFARAWSQQFTRADYPTIGAVLNLAARDPDLFEKLLHDWNGWVVAHFLNLCGFLPIVIFIPNFIVTNDVWNKL